MKKHLQGEMGDLKFIGEHGSNKGVQNLLWVTNVHEI